MWVEEPDLDEWEYNTIELWEEALASGEDISLEDFRENLLNQDVDYDAINEDYLEGELA